MNNKEKSAVKNFLRGYERETEKLKQIEADIDYINETLDSMPQLFDGMPRGSGILDKTAKDAQRLWQLQKDLFQYRNEAVEKRAQITEIIRKVPNIRYMTLLNLRYIKLKSWAEISLEMDRDPRWIFRMHNIALEEIKKILDMTI